jgi:hypothetical protein
MQGLNNNLTGRPYCKKKETSQVGYQEVTTQTSMQGQQMRKMTRKEFTSHVGVNEVLHHKIGRAWGLNTRSSYFQGQRDANSIEEKFLQSIFALNPMMMNPLKACIWFNL